MSPTRFEAVTFAELSTLSTIPVNSAAKSSNDFTGARITGALAIGDVAEDVDTQLGFTAEGQGRIFLKAKKKKKKCLRIITSVVAFVTIQSLTSDRTTHHNIPPKSHRFSQSLNA